MNSILAQDDFVEKLFKTDSKMIDLIEDDDSIDSIPSPTDTDPPGDVGQYGGRMIKALPLVSDDLDSPSRKRAGSATVEKKTSDDSAETPANKAKTMRRASDMQYTQDPVEALVF
jgi:hypothetical protein